MSLRLTEEEYAAILARQNRAADTASNLESDPKHGPPSKDVGEEVCSRVRIHVHSKRRRLCDPDGISAKWAIDGLVKGGLLRDDSAKYIEAVTFFQEHSEVDETIIEVWECPT